MIGTLVSRRAISTPPAGFSSYADIGDAIAAAMADPSVRGVILDVDSPGGEVGGLFDLVEQIGAIKAASRKPLWAVANEGALSAAYAIASTADRLYVTRPARSARSALSRSMSTRAGPTRRPGLAWTFVFAGEQKVDGNAHEPLSQRARDDHPGRCRPSLRASSARWSLPIAGSAVEAVRGTQAAIYRGDLAVRAGLADRRRHARSRHRRDGGRTRSRDSPTARTDQTRHQQEHLHGDKRD